MEFLNVYDAKLIEYGVAVVYITLFSFLWKYTFAR